MGAIAFDTLEFFETLRGAGVPEEQAKAFLTVAQKSHESADLATKQDIVGLRNELRYEIHDLRKDMDTKHKALQIDMQHQNKALELHLTIKLGAIVVAAAGAMPFLSKLLHLF